MKKAIISILNLFLIIMLLTISILVIISNTVLKKSYIETSLEKSGFYDELNIAIQNEFDIYLAQAGIKSGALKNLYTIEELKSDISNTLDAIYNSKTINVISSFMKEKINNKIDRRISIGNLFANTCF